MNLPPVYSASDVMALSSIRDKEREEAGRHKELDAIGKFKYLQALADQGKPVGYGSRQEMLSGLGLDIAQSPEAAAFRNSIAEGDAMKYGNDINYYAKQAADLPGTQKINEDLGKFNLGHLAVPTMMPKTMRELAGEYGYPASARPQAKKPIWPAKPGAEKPVEVRDAAPSDGNTAGGPLSEAESTQLQSLLARLIGTK
jgi:hypothetical protein